MSRHLSSKSTDLNQKLSRQMTSKKRKTSQAFYRESDNDGSSKKSFKIKEKYNSWKFQTEDEDDLDDYQLS